MTFSFPDCGGCRSCELACSFHRTGAFDISKSAIEVKHVLGGGYEVSVKETSSDTTITCDGCKGEDEPACVRFCHSADNLREEIIKIRRQMESRR